MALDGPPAWARVAWWAGARLPGRAGGLPSCLALGCGPSFHWFLPGLLGLPFSPGGLWFCPVCPAAALTVHGAAWPSVCPLLPLLGASATVTGWPWHAAETERGAPMEHGSSPGGVWRAEPALVSMPVGQSWSQALRVLGTGGSGPCCPLTSDLNFSKSPTSSAGPKTLGGLPRSGPLPPNPGRSPPTSSPFSGDGPLPRAGEGSPDRRLGTGGVFPQPSHCIRWPCRAHAHLVEGLPAALPPHTAGGRSVKPGPASLTRQRPLPRWWSPQRAPACGSQTLAPVGLTFCWGVAA